MSSRHFVKSSDPQSPYRQLHIVKSSNRINVNIVNIINYRQSSYRLLSFTRSSLRSTRTYSTHGILPSTVVSNITNGANTYFLPLSQCSTSSVPTPATPTMSIRIETTPAPTGRDPDIEATTYAYLIDSIPLSMYNKFHGCIYTYEIWEALNQEYSYKSRQDQLRLKGQINLIRKTADETLDEFIDRFDKLSTMYIDQNPNCQADQINSYFLQALEHFHLPHEKWSGFVIYLGENWYELTVRQLHARACSY